MPDASVRFVCSLVRPALSTNPVEWSVCVGGGRRSGRGCRAPYVMVELARSPVPFAHAATATLASASTSMTDPRRMALGVAAHVPSVGTSAHAELSDELR